MIDYALSRRARVQLRDIHKYSSGRWGEAQADKYLRTLFEAFGRIAQGRLHSRPIPAEFGARGQFSTCQQHFIYWRRQRSGSIEIVAVVDQRRLQSRQVRIAFDLPG